MGLYSVSGARRKDSVTKRLFTRPSKNSMSKKTCFYMTVLAFAVAASSFAQSLPEDECTNNAIHRTTPSIHFTIMSDPSVARHERTGLEWQRCPVGQELEGNVCSGSAKHLTWQEALATGAAKGQGWRVPNIKELLSIVEECRVNPPLNRVIFPIEPVYAGFWSSSPYAWHSYQYWIKHFPEGEAYPFEHHYRAQVRLVRGDYQ